MQQPDQYQDLHHNEEAWRAEVASRVNSYRRRKRAVGEAASLDFGPEAEAYTIGQAEPAPPHVSAAPVSRATFDTNYYRRMNAEALAPVVDPVDTAVAVEPEAESDAYEHPALDLEIRPAAPEDHSFLERRIDAPMTPEPEAETEPPQVQMQMEAALPAPPPPPEPSAPLQNNLIVFRRPLFEPPLAPQPSRDELAEPMNNRPRILEVPEDIMPPVQGSLFPEIRLDTDEQESVSREPEIEVPLPVAGVTERMLASLADWGVVVLASLLFAGLAWRGLPDVPHGKPFFMILGAVTVLFWAIYQHLFLLCAGCTPGMALRHIHLSTFDGRVPGWSERKMRARFMCISFISASMGFLWAMVDHDTLCWHDRVSQTFPTTE